MNFFQQLQNAFTLFLSLMVGALPFLLMGVLFSSLLLFFVDDRQLSHWLPRNPFLGALVGSCAGVFFPVCECGNVPVARRLLMQGAPSAVAIGFLLAAPTVNPIAFWVTLTAFRDQPEIVVLRVAFSLTIATIVACVFSTQSDLRPLLQPSLAGSMVRPPAAERPPAEPALAMLQSGTFLLGAPGGLLSMEALAFRSSAAGVRRKPLTTKLRLVLDTMIQEFRELAGVLVLGSGIAALIQAFISPDWIRALGQGPVTSIVAMMALTTVVSICSSVDAFFALAFASSFTTGSLLAFLVFGPMIDLKGIGLMLTIFKPRAIVYLFALAGQLTFLLALVMNFHIA